MHVSSSRCVDAWMHRSGTPHATVSSHQLYNKALEKVRVHGWSELQDKCIIAGMYEWRHLEGLEVLVRVRVVAPFLPLHVLRVALLQVLCKHSGLT